METNTNPLLQTLRLPGETYRLPSRGLFYSEGVLDRAVKDGEVEVLPLTAIDEVILNTPDKLLSGDAICDVISKCVPAVLKPKQLLIEDVDFLMMCLRHVSFGAKMEVTHEHDCANHKPHKYTVNVLKFITQATSIDPTVLNTQYQLSMPNGQVVRLRPLSYMHVIKLFQTTALSKTTEMTAEEAHQLIIGSMTGLIASVDNISDEEMIQEWLKQIPLGWKRDIEKQAQQLNKWGVNLTVTETCPDCGKEFELIVNPNPVSFFS